MAVGTTYVSCSSPGCDGWLWANRLGKTHDCRCGRQQSLVDNGMSYTYAKPRVMANRPEEWAPRSGWSTRAGQVPWHGKRGDWVNPKFHQRHPPRHNQCLTQPEPWQQQQPRCPTADSSVDQCKNMVSDMLRQHWPAMPAELRDTSSRCCTQGLQSPQHQKRPKRCGEYSRTRRQLPNSGACPPKSSPYRSKPARLRKLDNNYVPITRRW